MIYSINISRGGNQQSDDVFLDKTFWIFNIYFLRLFTLIMQDNVCLKYV